MLRNILYNFFNLIGHFITVVLTSRTNLEILEVQTKQNKNAKMQH
jgi:hypothetical protein